MQKIICEKCGKELEVIKLGNKLVTGLCSCRMQEIENERKKEAQQGEALLKTELNKKSGVGKKYNAVLLESILPKEGQIEATEKIKAFYTSFASGNNKELSGIALFGGVGSGKTMLSSALVNQLCADTLSKVTEQEKVDAFYHRYSIESPAVIVNTVEMIENIKQSYEAYDGYISRVKNCRLLILDDLGAARVTEWVDEKIYEIIDYRYSKDKTVILTSNSLPEELEKVFDRRITDRLKEMCRPVYIKTASLRHSASSF